ncbi:MAG TPA: NUDIX hydrolase [Ideonella sp.]|uniref:NUDIX hydrolase n=1 Tax=Ideonella sp. TaxID=1929293 RepID=UPI002E37EBB0|nr:NUDIX hydrolase [Ideonella sp.]HEX5687867.1 NUDIX hydrolase [Ideonella sp.]
MGDNHVRWKPSVTVAAVVSQGGRYLLVEEMTAEGLKLNNPAGHLDPGESLLDAVVREVLEETARPFHPEALVGAYLARFRHARSGEDISYLRFAICGEVGEAIAGRALDAPVQRTLWMTPAELRACPERHRSPLVMQCIAHHLAGVRAPLSLLHADPSLYGHTAT